jgi:hypothetical protein
MPHPALSRLVTVALIAAAALPATTSAQGLAVEPSGRATTAVTINRQVPRGTPAAERPAPMRISIDYGQPHLRGRDALPLIPAGDVWRLGANTSTSLTTDVDLVIGGASVPKGTYTLWLQRNASGAKLIVNKQTGQWGTAYNAAQDLVRVDMRSRKITHPLDALQIALVPAASGPSGVLRVTWGAIEFETDWSVKQ